MTELETLLKASIEIGNMRKDIKRKDAALRQSLLLMRKEYASLANPSSTCGAVIAACMQSDANAWADAILAAEKALQPVTPEPIPALVCNACDRETPVTIMGLCIKCDDFRQAIAEAITECEVIEIPRRIQ